MCAKLIVQTGITEVVYIKEGEIDTDSDKGKIYEASRRILATLPPKYTTYKCINIQAHNFYREKDSIEKIVREVIQLMKSRIDNTVADETDITVKRAFQSILEASLPPKYIIF